MRYKAVILAVGTELTTGQVVNSNAVWVSQRLVDRGFEVVAHETVPDDKPLILSALDRCAMVADHVFVTGGLGPTSDDFTRDVVAAWLGLPLEFSQGSWERLSTILSERKVPLVESQRQQCFFPAGAKVLLNSKGTADAFFIDGNGCKVFVLPGPPVEIQAVWKETLTPLLDVLAPTLAPEKLFTWQCIGKSEAELGEITEKVFAGSAMRTGYRASPPYVEIKIWVPETEMKASKAKFVALEQAIEPWIITRQGEDLAESFLAKLASSGCSVLICDHLSDGVLSERLGAANRNAEKKALLEIRSHFSGLHGDAEATVRKILQQAVPGTFALAGFNEGVSWAWGAKLGSEELRIVREPAPYPTLKNRVDRAKRAAAEIFMKRAIAVL